MLHSIYRKSGELLPTSGNIVATRIFLGEPGRDCDGRSPSIRSLLRLILAHSWMGSSVGGFIELWVLLLVGNILLWYSLEYDREKWSGWLL